MRRLAAAMISAALLAVAAPTPTAQAAGGLRTWRVTRADPSRPRVADMEVLGTAIGPNPMLLVFELAGAGSKRTVPNARFADHGSVLPSIYTGGSTVSTCPTLPGCDLAYPAGWRLAIDSNGRAVRSEYLIVADKTDVDIDLNVAGWRVREVAPLRVQRILPADGTATGAYTPAVTAEQYEHSTAAGGRHGSVAWAFLPCSAAGHGTATLRATPRHPAVADQALTCEDETKRSATATANRAVTWTVSGSVVGAGTRATRLLVVDLPKP